MLTQSSGYKDGCSFVDTVIGRAALEQYLRGAPKGTKVEAWEGRIFTCSRPTSWDVSVAEGCKVTVSAVYLPKKRPGPPAAGPLYRILFGWSRLLYTASSGIWIFRGALRGSQVMPALASCFDWVVRGTYRTAWAVQPCCRCSYSYGNGPAVGPQVSGNWEFLRGLWKAVAPLMAPWCADGEMPTCANLNLYGGSGSRVRWHSDNEGLFGRRGESKLIVSMSFGVSALFKWKPGPSPDSDASASWLHHGDLLVMDGCCQDEYLHCTDPLQGGERVNITFRWIRNHVPRCPLAAGVVCCLPTCAKGSFVYPNTEVFLPGTLSVVLLVLLGWGFFFLIALFPSWPELRCRALRCYWLSCRVRRGFGKCSFRQNSGSLLFGGCYAEDDWLLWMRSTLVQKRPPSLLNNDAYFVFWTTGAPWGNGRRTYYKTLFLPFLFFSLLVSRISSFRFWGKILRYLWIGRARHPGPSSNNLDVEVFNVGGFLTHGDYVLDTDADFVAVVEHRLVPARARSEGKRLLQAGARSVWAPASLEGGMLVMLASVWLACVVLPFLCLPLLLSAF